MSELLFDMEADQATASSIEKMDNTGLASVAEIARAVRNQEDLVNKLDDELKEAKRELLKLTDEDLPAMLLELGLSSFELEDGSKVTVRPTYGAHIKAENKATAFDWLRQNGFDDIIKNTVSCNFGRGEDQEASQFIDYAQGLGYAAEQASLNRMREWEWVISVKMTWRSLSSKFYHAKTQLWMTSIMQKRAISLIPYRIRSTLVRQVYVSYLALISGVILSGFLGALVAALL